MGKTPYTLDPCLELNIFRYHNQLFFPSWIPARAELIKGHDNHNFFRYGVAPNQPNGILGFYFLNDLDGFCIYENDRIPPKQEIDGYAYEFQLPVEKPAINLLYQRGLIKSIPLQLLGDKASALSQNLILPI